MKKDTRHVEELEIAPLSRIHFEGGSVLRTSRANPARSAETLQNVADSLERLGASYLLTIGGDDTASGAAAVARVLGGKLTVAHVPKTIDNDLPLPPGVPTFGFTTAVDVGKDLVHNLMKDAATTDKWFFVTIMGRHAGHLALGIGSAAGATVTIIGEEFPPGPVSLDQIADMLEGAIIKRRVLGREHGVALLAEGLIERLDPDTLSHVERAGPGEGANPFGVFEIRAGESNHVGGEHAVRFRLHIDVADSESPGLRIDQITEWNRHECLALYRHHGIGAPLDQKPRRPVTETSTVVDVEAPGRGTAKLVADVLRHNADRKPARAQIRHHPLLEQA